MATFCIFAKLFVLLLNKKNNNEKRQEEIFKAIQDILMLDAFKYDGANANKYLSGVQL